jgi:hypothetical protein
MNLGFHHLMNHPNFLKSRHPIWLELAQVKECKKENYYFLKADQNLVCFLKVYYLMEHLE